MFGLGLIPLVELQALLLGVIEALQSRTSLEKIKLKAARTQLRHIEAAVISMDAVMKTFE